VFARADQDNTVGASAVPTRLARRNAVMKKPALLLVLSLAVVALALVPTVGLAAKGGNGDRGGGGAGGGGGDTPYTVTVDQAAPYHFGQQITVSTDAPVYPDNMGPWIDLICYQGNTKVLAVTHAGFSGGWYYGWPFTLGPTSMWSGGAAECEVVVSHQSRRKTVVDARTAFHVEP
jgi:hypothetical protein